MRHQGLWDTFLHLATRITTYIPINRLSATRATHRQFQHTLPTSFGPPLVVSGTRVLPEGIFFGSFAPAVLSEGQTIVRPSSPRTPKKEAADFLHVLPLYVGNFMKQIWGLNANSCKSSDHHQSANFLQWEDLSSVCTIHASAGGPPLNISR